MAVVENPIAILDTPKAYPQRATDPESRGPEFLSADFAETGRFPKKKNGNFFEQTATRAPDLPASASASEAWGT